MSAKASSHLTALQADLTAYRYYLAAERGMARNTVLAYEKDVPTKGGYVLMGDATVKNMTADDFKKAIVAKKK